MNSISRGAVLAALAALAAATAASCENGADTESADEPSPHPESSVEARIAESPRAKERIAAHRQRFAFAESTGASFEAAPGGRVQVAVDAAARGTARRARVELPTRASAFARLEDPASGIALELALRGASDEPLSVADGVALYRGALGGADVIHVPGVEGTEDLIVFEGAPSRARVVYDIDVSEVSGLRLVGNTLELLDEGGAPRLRVNPPFVIDRDRKRHEATLTVAGCAFDTSPAAPWGRRVTEPGAEVCAVIIGWSEGVSYPAMLDPQWVLTGSMPEARINHQLTALQSGLVLVSGGRINIPPPFGSSTLATLGLLFDEATGTFAVTGGTSRFAHSATLLASGTVLVAGGRDSNGSDVQSASVYDPATGGFSATGGMPGSKSYHEATLLPSGTVLISGEGTNAFLYDPAAGAFSSTGSSVGQHWGATATLLPSGRVVVAGDTAGGAGTRVELYDPAAGTFSVTSPLPSSRYDHTATLLSSGLVLLAGGGPSTTAVLYDHVANTFTPTGNLTIGKTGHTATLLRSGKVLLVGSDIPTANTQAYDPGTGTFANRDGLVVARYGHRTAELPSGRVLIAGGVLAGSVLTATAEIYAGAVDGAACAANQDCDSDVCDGSVCCVSACTTCETCEAGTGACIDVVAADDPDSCAGAQSCDASGVCKLGVGQVCGAGSVCATGLCVDGFCCNAACGGGCDRCDIAGSAGTCSVLGPGAAGSCDDLCDGLSGACPGVGSCDADIDCVAAFYCASGGACAPRKAQGGACDDLGAGTDCAADGCRVCSAGVGRCVDNVCCNSVCGAACDVCSEALGAATDGTCATAPEGTQTQTAPACNGLRACNGTATSCTADGSCASDADCASTAYCSNDGACLPRKAQGAQCDDAASADCQVQSCRVCATDACIDGRCCESDCGPCGSCGNAGGVCLETGAGQPPVPANACGPYLCGGASPLCPTSCTSDAGCGGSTYCLGGACVPKLSNGTDCTSDGACTSGACSDGVCCNVDCSGLCLACTAANKQSGMGTGTCGNARQGTNPGGQCTSDPNNACGTIDSCVGTGATCALAPVGRSCGDTSCSGNEVTGDICNGVGACVTDATEDCAPYVCQGAACTSPCEGDGDCLDGFYCLNGTCIEEIANGLGCTIDNECDSGFCVDGVCCNSPCQGQCQACAEDGALGTCTTVEGAPRPPRDGCAGTSLCEGSCDGGDPNACASPGSATSCGDDAACVGLDVSQPAESCDGSGACETPSTRNCAPYTCDAPTGECKTSCVSSAECAQGATCDTLSGACAPTNATCADDFTVLTAGGQLVPCTPYRCLVGACQQQCVTDDDCAEDYACEASSCVVDPSGSGGGDPGAGGAGPSSGSGGGAAPTSASTAVAGGVPSTTAAGSDGDGGGDAGESAADGGCGCEAPGGRPRGSALAAVALLVAGAAGARRRHRTSTCPLGR